MVTAPKAGVLINNRYRAAVFEGDPGHETETDRKWDREGDYQRLTRIPHTGGGAIVLWGLPPIPSLGWRKPTLISCKPEAAGPDRLALLLRCHRDVSRRTSEPRPPRRPPLVNMAKIRDFGTQRPFANLEVMTNREALAAL